jgi:hypothetical protein
MTDHNLALRLWHSVAPKLDLTECDHVIDALATLGYRPESGDDTSRPTVGPGRYTPLANEIARIVPVEYRDVLVACTGLNHLGYKIRRIRKAA